MKRRVQILFFVVLCAFLPFCAFADTLSATGEGSSEAEARLNALNNLSMQIQVNVSTSYGALSYDNGRGASGDFISLQSAASSNFDFVGHTFSQVRQSGRKWSVTVTLPQSSAPLYYDRLNSLYREINSMYVSLGRLANPNSVSLSQLEQLSALLDDYEANRNVAVTLDSSRIDSIQELPVHRSVVRSLLDSKRNQSLSAIREDMAYYESLSELGFLSDEGRITLEGMKADAEAQRSAIAADAEVRREQTAARIEVMQETFGTKSSVDIADLYRKLSQNDFSVTDAINNIESNKRVFQYVKDEMSSALGDLYSEMTAAQKEYMDGELSMPYSAIQLDSNGKPRAEDVQRRRSRAQEEIDKKITPAYVEQGKKIARDYLRQMADVADSIISDIEDVNDIDITYNTLTGGGLSSAITGYDVDRHVYYGYAILTIGTASIRMDIEIPYEDWTGDKIPDERDYEYEVYAATASRWLDVLQSDTSVFLLELTFNVEPYVDSSDYGLVIRRYEITRLDNGKRVARENIDEGRLPDVKVSSSTVNIMNFMPTGKAGSMGNLIGIDSLIESAMDKHNIARRGKVYSKEGTVNYFSTTDDSQRHRAAYGSLQFDNLYGLTFGGGFSGKSMWEGQRVTPYFLGPGAFDELHFSRVGVDPDFFINFGVNANIIFLPASDEEGNDISGSLFGLVGKIGIGTSMPVFEEGFLAIGLNATSEYAFGSNFLALGAELSVTGGSYFANGGLGLGVSVRYDFWQANPLDDSPWTVTFYAKSIWGQPLSDLLDRF